MTGPDSVSAPSRERTGDDARMTNETEPRKEEKQTTRGEREIWKDGDKGDIKTDRGTQKVRYRGR